MKTLKQSTVPSDWWQGLKENWKADIISGFMVFLLALPLSMGIAKASEFKPIYGIVTAIIGGMVVSFFAGSKLTIKGPAAGLIVIVAGAVQEFGGGVIGWQLALGAMAVAAVVQIGFGVLKLGRLSDYFPSSAVHGMLAAIGIIIISKQVHSLLGIDPKVLTDEAGHPLSPIKLLLRIPDSLLHEDIRVTIIGVVSLMVLFGYPYIKNSFIKSIPQPLFVLALAIPYSLFMDFAHSEPYFDLVHVDNLTNSLGLNIRFDGIAMTGIFLKYVLLLSLIGSIESLLTVKAIDNMDSYRRKSDANKDLIAVGIGNLISAILGGLPMISEVARSSANVNSKAVTRWANFFHGMFLLLAVLLIRPILEMIPIAALSAMLIAVGYRLASPTEFIKTYKTGKEQFAVFLITILVTLAEDLLLGIVVGVVLELLINMYYSRSVRAVFTSSFAYSHVGNKEHTYIIDENAVFSNFIPLKNKIVDLPEGSNVTVDVSNCRFIDHSTMENFYQLEYELSNNGSQLQLMGLEKLAPLGSRNYSAKHWDGSRSNMLVSPRTQELQSMLDTSFEIKDKNLDMRTYMKQFHLQSSIKNVYNIAIGKWNTRPTVIFDCEVVEQKSMHIEQHGMTILVIDLEGYRLPDFMLEREGAFDFLKEIGSDKKDIDFQGHSVFSNHYLLKGNDEEAIRKIFTPELILFFEENKKYIVELKQDKLMLHRGDKILNKERLEHLFRYVEKLLEILSHSLKK